MLGRLAGGEVAGPGAGLCAAVGLCNQHAAHGRDRAEPDPFDQSPTIDEIVLHGTLFGCLSNVRFVCCHFMPFL
jgi:hypothetical protein